MGFILSHPSNDNKTGLNLQTLKGVFMVSGEMLTLKLCFATSPCGSFANTNDKTKK